MTQIVSRGDRAKVPVPHDPRTTTGPRPQGLGTPGVNDPVLKSTDQNYKLLTAQEKLELLCHKT